MVADIAMQKARVEWIEEAIRLCDAVRLDGSVPIDDELDALRRLLDRRRLVAMTLEQRLTEQLQMAHG